MTDNQIIIQQYTTISLQGTIIALIIIGAIIWAINKYRDDE